MNTEEVQVQTDAGADAEAYDKDQMTSLERHGCRNPRIALTLVDASADLNARPSDIDGFTALNAGHTVN